MNTLRALKILGAATICAAILAACGGSSKPAGPSALDPANKAPASSILYASFTVRPQGSLSADMRGLISKLAGPKAVGEVTSALRRSLHGKVTWSGLKPWLGQRVGVALTSVPAGTLTARALERYLVVIFPTDKPVAARKFLAAHPSTVPGQTARISGDYVLAGYSAGVAAAATTTSADSLASLAAYQDAVSKIGPEQFGSVYARVGAILKVIRPRLLRAEPTGALRAQAAAELKRLSPSASATLGLTVSAHTVAFDVITSGFPAGAAKTTASAGDVSDLPGDSWLALAASLSPKSFTMLNAEGGSLSTQTGAKLNVIATLEAEPVFNFMFRDLGPALGPLSVSVAGTTPLTLQAGAVLSPDVPSAGGRLLSALRKLVSSSHLPIKVSGQSSKVIATFGYSTLSQLLSPSSTLAGNPTYKEALAQLPAGSKVPLFVNFGPISEFGALDKSAKDRKSWQIIGKLNYLIAGGTHGDWRLVLGIH